MTPWYAPWLDDETAAAYGAFCRQFALYRQGSEQLAGMVDLASAHRVMDLACGTGSTTAVVLSRIPENAAVISVDVSAAMLAEAQRSIDDPRVRWVEAPAEEVDRHVDATLDAVLCSAAIWQTELERTFAAVRRLLRSGGALAFDIAGGFVEVPASAGSLPPLPPASLVSAYRDAANELYHLEPGSRPRGPLTVEEIRGLLRAASLELREVHVADQEATREEIRAWLEIPVFNDQFRGRLTHAQRAAALALAWDRLANDPPREVIRNVFFAATAI
ncbi:MAG: class I SAM-dependent methyltransferase [Candidatus Dormibacteraeota bacterium]|nr:class I SAM-dependent methyltransferase [Candidatus Dormibacteraeota bacterium]